MRTTSLVTSPSPGRRWPATGPSTRIAPRCGARALHGLGVDADDEALGGGGFQLIDHLVGQLVLGVHEVGSGLDDSAGLRVDLEGGGADEVGDLGDVGQVHAPTVSV